MAGARCRGRLRRIELWSLTTDAAEAWRTPVEAVRWLRAPQAAVAAGPPAHHLKLWDELSARRRLPAIGGLDGHQPGLRVGGRVRSPVSHRRTFGLLRTHLLCDRPLSGEVEADRRAILAAMRAGAAWLACPRVAPATGARLWAERDDGAVIAMGGEAPAIRCALRVRLPQRAEVRIVHDGAVLHEASAAKVDLAIDEPGVYRAEGANRRALLADVQSGPPEGASRRGQRAAWSGRRATRVAGRCPLREAALCRIRPPHGTRSDDRRLPPRERS